VAARAIAGAIDPLHLAPDYMIPSVFNRDVAPAVAAAAATVEDGVARRRLDSGGVRGVDDQNRNRAGLQHVVAYAAE
jgi:malic enzyme